jgi:two-component system, LuxR family, response regulator FixJ
MEASCLPMIILIDDDDATRDSVRLLLECEGLLVRDFASCAEFLAAEGTAHPDCLILDIHMPGITGIEFLERLRARGASVPAILMTGDPTPEIGKRAAAADVVAVLEKPFQGSELVDLVHSVFDSPRPQADVR